MKLKQILIIFIIMISLLGCSDKGKIKIINNTDYDDIWYQLNDNEKIFIDSGNSAEFDYKLTNYLLFSDNKNIDLIYGGKFVVTQNKNIKLSAGDSKKIDIWTDAGEIVIENGTYTQYITEVNISQTVTNYGDNLLSNPIGPFEFQVFNAESGFWNIKLNPDGQDPIYFENVFIGLESTWTFTLIDE